MTELTEDALIFHGKRVVEVNDAGVTIANTIGDKYENVVGFLVTFQRVFGWKGVQALQAAFDDSKIKALTPSTFVEAYLEAISVASLGDYEEWLYAGDQEE